MCPIMHTNRWLLSVKQRVLWKKAQDTGWMEGCLEETVASTKAPKPNDMANTADVLTAALEHLTGLGASY